MTAGIIQLVAYGEQDIFLTTNPQITLFKVVYRRHTNFSIEQIPQTFTGTLNFGKKLSCIISKSGDLINNIVLVITLPEIQSLLNINGSKDNITKFAWIRKIGYGIIKSIDIEIGGQLIDRHYGEWLNIWNELNGKKNENIDKMIGNIKDIYTYTESKQEYKLYIPLQFWFCRSSNLALPIMCLQYNDVKINVEINDLDTCYTTTPTHCIKIENDIVNFQKYEYISQTVGNNEAYGIFSHFDPMTKLLYYTKISTMSFLAINDTNFYDDSVYTTKQRQAIIDTYSITGRTSGYVASACINVSTTNVVASAYTHNDYANIKLGECFLLIDYIFLDNTERLKFFESKHEYLIEQLICTGGKTLDGPVRSVKIGMINPCKLMVWTTQFSYMLNKKINDTFNYTDSYIYDDINYTNSKIGNNIIKQSTILFNGCERLGIHDDIYYGCVQPYQYFKYAPETGINIYSFGLQPDSVQPSGTCNLSKLDNINIKLSMTSKVSSTNTVIFKAYGLTTNMLRINSGIGGLIFTQ